METKRLEAFVALVDTGGFRQAADALFITQPALSQQVARLERDIGVDLVDRSTRPITVTAAGREFYFRCKTVLEAMRGVDEMSESVRELHFGRVRIGIVPAMLFSAPARAVRSFQERHPDCDVVVNSIATSRLIEELERGSIDVAVLLTQPDLRDLSSTELFSEEYLVCLPSGHPLAEQDEVEFSQLRDERFVQGKRAANPAGFDSIVAACRSAGFSPNVNTTPYGSYLDHAGMVSAGMGVSFAPRSFSELRPNDVVYRRLIHPSVGMSVSVSWYERRLDAAGRAFVQHCISECSHPQSD